MYIYIHIHTYMLYYINKRIIFYLKWLYKLIKVTHPNFAPNSWIIQLIDPFWRKSGEERNCAPQTTLSSRKKWETQSLSGHQQRDIMVVWKRKLRGVNQVDKIVDSHWRFHAERTTMYYYRAASIILAPFRRKDGDEIGS